MCIDFSQENFQYLSRAKELACRDSQLAAIMLDMSPDLVLQLAALPVQRLAPVLSIRIPLFIPHREEFWWARLLTAIPDGRSDEIQAILDHAPLLLGSNWGSGE